MPKLSEREYKIFELFVRGDRPFGGLFQVPRNTEDITESSIYKKFLKERPFARLTQRTREIAELTGGLPRKAVEAFESPAERAQRGIPARQAQRAIGRVGDAPPAPTGVQVPPFPTEPPPPGFEYRFDRDLNRWVPQREAAPPPLPAGLTPFQEAGEERATERARLTAEFREAEAGRAAETTRLTAQFRGEQQQQQQVQFQQQLDFQQQQSQLAAEEQRRQFSSQLAANPINWLQYAAYTGQPPVIQPWMIPLGFQNTGGALSPQGGIEPENQLQAGQSIPGFDPQQFQGNQLLPFGSFSNLPQLTTPSAQLQARWGPTAQAQFLGFQRARTGASPQETTFRLGSQRAPAGRFPGFSSFR